MHKIREVESTADKALEIEGDGLEDILIGAVYGMYSLFTEPVHVMTRATAEVRFITVSNCTDPGQLTVELLNEILYQGEKAEGQLFMFDLHEWHNDGGDGPYQLTAYVFYLPGRYNAFGAAIKAATYHDLVVEERDGKWRAKITFDV